MILPTVAIRHPLDPDVRMTINAADFREGEHELWTEPEPAADDLRVRRGARGLWFVLRGGEAVSKGHATEAEAEITMREMGA